MLLLRRNEEPMKGRWTGVGGKTKFYEEPLESCVREVREETGLNVESQLAGLITAINKSTSSRWFLFVYVSDGYKEKLKQYQEGFLEWVSEKQLYKKDLALLKASLPYLLSRRRKERNHWKDCP